MNEIIELRWAVHVGERFEDGVFDTSVGKDITVHDRRGTEPAERRARVLSAQVADDGLSVVLQILLDVTP